MNKNNLPKYVKRAEESTIKSDFKNVIETCTNILNIDSKNVDAYVYRAYAFLETGRFNDALTDCNEAIEDFRTAISLHPSNRNTVNYISKKYNLNIVF